MTTSTTPSPAAPIVSKPVKKTPMWAKILLVIVVLALIGGGVFVGIQVGKFLGAAESRDTQVIRSLQSEEQVILVTAGMTDVEEERGDGLRLAIGDLPFFTLPGTERSVLVRYEYEAKFGIEGKDVKITQTGDTSYRISIPEFIYLGYANPDLTIADEKNGALSWTTPEIDVSEVFEEVLSNDYIETHVDGFRPLLKEQAEAFYTRIVGAIDPTITLEFEFTE